MRDFLENAWETFWAILGIIVIGVASLFVLGILVIIILGVFSSCNATTPAAQIRDLSVGYLTKSDYDRGDYAESAVTADTVFTSGATQYAVIDFTIVALDDNDGNESVRITARASDNAALDVTVEEANTGKMETVKNDDGSEAFDLFYTVPTAKDTEKTVRLILKLTPNVSGDVGLDILISGGNGATVIGETQRSLTLRVEATPENYAGTER